MDPPGRRPTRMSHSRPSRLSGRRTAWAAATAALLATTGCQAGSGPLSRWRTAHDESMAKGITKEELGDSRGMMAHWLTPEKAPHAEPGKVDGLVMGREGWQQ